MSGLIIALSVVSSFIAGMFVIAVKRMMKWMEIAVTYQRELLETKRMLANAQTALEIERALRKNSLAIHVATPAPLSSLLDDRTKGLIRLAVLNPEKLEGESAAMIVCKRLKEKIDG